MITPEMLARLPKWARHEIERLNHNVAHAECVARHADGTEPTRAQIYTRNDEAPRYFDDRYGVVFQLGEPGSSRTEVRVKIGEDFTGRRAIEVHAGDIINVMPASGNRAFVTIAAKK